MLLAGFAVGVLVLSEPAGLPRVEETCLWGLVADAPRPCRSVLYGLLRPILPQAVAFDAGRWAALDWLVLLAIAVPLAIRWALSSKSPV